MSLEGRMHDQIKRHDRHAFPQAHLELGPDDRPANLPHVDLEIVRGRAKNRVRAVTVPAFLIGSARDCDLVLGDPRFPEVYAYLLLKPTGVFIRHLGFVPEMTLNGRMVTNSELADGDHICTGPYDFRVHIWNDPDDDWIKEGREALSVTEHIEMDEKGYNEVQELLRDIRTTLRPDIRAMRLYAASDIYSHGVTTTPAWRAARMTAVRLAWGA